ncbi:PqqD family peptide modification chaperone [Novispirillum sp. DQ9]|uniref:PqqD family peptide modification chaperone n=1 Tax=Novispirillum sp. DQ9 TaxID=3398612 RepID=UPI003C7AA1DE
MPITLTDIITRAEGVLSAEIFEETVLMSEANGRYYCLTETSQEIWKQLDRPLATNELLQTMSEKYEVPTSAIEADVVAFLEHFKEKGLITVKNTTAE